MHGMWSKIGHSVRIGTLALLAAATLAAAPALAQSDTGPSNPFEPGWTLDASDSLLRVTSVKNNAVVETSSFAAVQGAIAPDGTAELRVMLDSVDTGIDLRNVRMRFLFFETFSFPEATVTIALTQEMVADLPEVRRKTLTLPYTINLHGVTQELSADVVVTLLDDDTVSIASAAPLVLKTPDFNLEEGRAKLEEAAGVTIVSAGAVTFDFVFRRSGTQAEEPQVVAAAAVASTAPASTALETKGNFSVEECTGRFEILSRTGNIYFRTASAQLDDASRPVLNTIADIVRRCPDLTVLIAGHTDSDGSDAANQALSEARAQSVREYLAGTGIPGSRLVTVGYGETRPQFPNTTPENKSRNRRIEFSSLN